jgi:hypothetical protein
MKGFYSYPLFNSENGIKTANMNLLNAFLEQRERLSRNRQFGKGIFIGLDIEIWANHSITIKAGYGYTSQGLPIEHAETVFTHCTPYSPLLSLLV